MTIATDLLQRHVESLLATRRNALSVALSFRLGLGPPDEGAERLLRIRRDRQSLQRRVRRDWELITGLFVGTGS